MEAGSRRPCFLSAAWLVAVCFMPDLDFKSRKPLARLQARSLDRRLLHPNPSQKVQSGGGSFRFLRRAQGIVEEHCACSTGWHMAELEVHGGSEDSLSQEGDKLHTALFGQSDTCFRIP